MPTLKDSFCPDEWVSATRSLVDMYSTASKTNRAGLKLVMSIGLPAAVGLILGFLFTPGLLPSSAGGFAKGILPFAGILAGFVVTLMLVTGRTDKADKLDFEDAQEFRDKVIYLLWSQALTLLSHMGTAIVAIIVLIADAGSSNWALWVTVPILFAALTVSLTRTLLLPLQIFELHRFVLDMTIAEKEQEVNDTASRLHK